MKYTLSIVALLLSFAVFSQENTYRYTVDLTKVDNDKLMINLKVPTDVKKTNEKLKQQQLEA